ncbi:MAG: hypothetical protein HOI95_01050 [Chromatiales bacterium]|jgi:hypothetical protein|nr:hypothetical protein [Chromatiales bacterium]
MPTVDQFQSVFLSTVREPFAYAEPSLERVTIICDLEEQAAATFTESVKQLVGSHGDRATWRTVTRDKSDTVEALLGLVESDSPDLVVSYRNVHSTAWTWPHSLGRHLDILTQATDTAVLVLPHPNDAEHFAKAVSPVSRVMAVSGHLAGEGALVNQAAAYAGDGGTVLLAHVEDDATFERYMNAVSKIPGIDTEPARSAILAQLLKEPGDYVTAVRNGLAAAGVQRSVESLTETGHHVDQYRQLIEANNVQLVVLNTKDDGQDAMHGVAYPLAIELRHIPLLML